jgi:hypothetical protein
MQFFKMVAPHGEKRLIGLSKEYQTHQVTQFTSHKQLLSTLTYPTLGKSWNHNTGRLSCIDLNGGTILANDVKPHEPDTPETSPVKIPVFYSKVILTKSEKATSRAAV